ncbi:MAG TPA: endonuclease III [Pyrinomonadaceae bacterium]|nr:endonuclease III [Pyrinomonadaceae bacterium]
MKNTPAADEAERERARRIVRLLRREYPDARCSLDHTNPLELLVATVLSAQCTDERVNLVTAELFRKYRSCEDYLRVSREELEQDIRPTGFFRNKARAIQGACRIICERHGGRVPATMEELLELPGVARKTANVVLGNAYGQASGVVVDTHVGRLSERLGLSVQKTPEKVERDLMALVPARDWVAFSHLLIAHGRAVCKARTPLCDACVLKADCPWYQSNQSRVMSHQSAKPRQDLKRE